MCKSLGLFLLACAAGAAVGVSFVSAAPPRKPQSPYLAQIGALHAVKVLLEGADRDYDGHRAAAVKAVTAAMHALETGYAHVAFPKPNGKGGTEAQALSDRQLNDAITNLQTIQTQLKGATAQAAAASTGINAAIAELKVALTIK